MDKWFAQQASRGNLYHASNSAATASTALATTHTGLVLSNPVGSGKWLVLKSFRYMSTTTTTTRALGLCVSPSRSSTNVTHTTPVVVHNAILLGSNIDNGTGLADESATLPTTPVSFTQLLWHGSTAAGELPAVDLNFNGSVIVPSGMYIGTYHITGAVTGLGSFVWAEVNEGTDIPG